MLLQQQGSRVEIARPQVFSGKIEEVSAFVNAAHLYIRMKMTEEAAATQVAWVLSYVQGGIAEAWKDNLLDELAKGESEVESAEQLFTKIRNNFGEMLSLSLDNSRTTQGECLERTRWSSPLDWTTYLYYFYKWLYTTSPRSYVLLECSTIT